MPAGKLKNEFGSLITIFQLLVFVDEINGYNDGPLYLEGVMSSFKYPEQPPIDKPNNKYIKIRCESLSDELYMTFTLLSPQAQFLTTFYMLREYNQMAAFLVHPSLQCKTWLRVPVYGDFRLTKSVTRQSF